MTGTMKHHHDRLAVPPLHSGTIEYMERRFPVRSPDPADSGREIWLKAGERRAVAHMRNLLDKQERAGPVFGGIRV